MNQVKNKIVYNDRNIEILEIDSYDEFDFQTNWISDNQQNNSYMLAKLCEYLGNTFAGAWLVKEGETATGMKGFRVEWINDTLFAKWI